MAKLRIRIILILMIMAVGVGVAIALDAPHNEDNGPPYGPIDCFDCHMDFSGQLPTPGPSLTRFETIELLCGYCHYPAGPGIGVETHQGQTCTVCHNPHIQEQKNVYGSTYEKLIKTQVETPNSGRKIVKFMGVEGPVEDIDSPADFADGDSTYDGICEVCHTATAYHRNDASEDHTHNAGKNCTWCHKHDNGFLAGHGDVGSSCGACHFVNGEPIWASSACFDCHGFSHVTHTESSKAPLKLLFSIGSEHQTDLDSENISAGLRQEFENNGCPLSQNATVLVQKQGSGWRIDDSDNEQTYIIRKEGSELDIYSLGMNKCHDCHLGLNPAVFVDGEELEYTNLCDDCHSPGGGYDGVDAASLIGAKNNWDSGVYSANDLLVPGKEQWCVGCHDDEPAEIAQLTAPDVSLFWIAGHGRGDTGLCTDCHDTTVAHIDGDARTYAFDSAYYAPGESGVAYAAGYRLRYIGDEVPLMIPVNYGITFSYSAQTMKDNAFRLCFSCHDSLKILDDTPGDGIDSNFKASLPNPPRDYSYAWGSGADVNEHVSHIMNYIGPFADSDWDTGTTGPGGSNGNDTLMSCSSCHNVHGALDETGGFTNEAMIRDGGLAGRSGYGFSYVIEDTGSGGYPQVTSTGATQATSVGAIFRNNTDNMCGGSMCHGDPAPPPGSSYDASGSGWGTYLEYYRP